MPHDIQLKFNSFQQHLVAAFEVNAGSVHPHSYPLTIEPAYKGQIIERQGGHVEALPQDGFLLKVGTRLAPDGASYGLRNAFKMFDHGHAAVRETKTGIWVASRGMETLENAAKAAGDSQVIALFMAGYNEGVAASLEHGIRVR